MKLSIIIPVYNTLGYVKELLNVIVPQITDEVEIIVVDDGSKEDTSELKKYPIKYVRKENGGASSARNAGLALSEGEYISFIDSDDLVSDNYIKTILKNIQETNLDYYYISWKAIGTWKDTYIITDRPPEWNLCVWNTIWRKEIIGNTKFNEKKLVVEDAEFIQTVIKPEMTKGNILDVLYIYRTGRTDNLTTMFNKGLLDTGRVVYNIPHVTEDMKNLLPEIEEKYKENEIIILTNKNDLPELSRYAMIMTPRSLSCTEFHGTPTPLVKVLPKPVRNKVLIYMENIHEIGGIESYIDFLASFYGTNKDLAIVYKNADRKQLVRLKEKIQCIKFLEQQFICDVVYNMSCWNFINNYIEAKEYIQMIHADYKYLIENKMFKYAKDPKTTSHLAVSKFARDQFLSIFPNETCDYIYPVVPKIERKRVLKLVTATRKAKEKGIDRMRALAIILKENNIPYTWTIYSDVPVLTDIPEVYNKLSCLNINEYLNGDNYDYMVQLSDTETWCFSVTESLLNGLAVICTDIPSLHENGVVDGKNGYFVDFELSNIDIEKIYNNVPKNFKYSIPKSEKSWEKILENYNREQPYIPTVCSNIDPVYRVRQVEGDDYELPSRRHVHRGDIYYIIGDENLDKALKKIIHGRPSIEILGIE